MTYRTPPVDMESAFARFFMMWKIAANRPRMQTPEFFSNFGGSESGLRPLFDLMEAHAPQAFDTTLNRRAGPRAQKRRRQNDNRRKRIQPQAGSWLHCTLCDPMTRCEKDDVKSKNKLQRMEMRGILHNRLICFIKLQKGLRP